MIILNVLTIAALMIEALAPARSKNTAMSTKESIVANRPPIVVTRSPDGRSITLSWTNPAFRLRCTDELKKTDTVWTDIPGQLQVTVPIVPGQHRFYQLISP